MWKRNWPAGLANQGTLAIDLLLLGFTQLAGILDIG